MYQLYRNGRNIVIAEQILSVKTSELLDRVWDILTCSSSYFESKGTNIDDIIAVYNELCKCSKEINTCESEIIYENIEDRINKCEKAVDKFV